MTRIPPDAEARLSKAGSKTGTLQRAVLALLRTHEAQGAIPTSRQFLWYELIQNGVVEKSKARGHPGVNRGIDQDVADALMELRKRGVVPWGWVVDETRQVYMYSGAPTVRDGLLAALDTVRLDPWRGRPAPLILCESRSLAGVLRPTAAAYCCPIAATNGHAGGFLRTDLVPLLRGGRPVLYFGDLDLAGGDIEANTRAVLGDGWTWRETGEPCRPSSWERLALTESQVQAYGLSDLVIMKRDERFRPARVFPAIETEALSQATIVAILTAHLDARLPEPLADVQVREREQRAGLRRILAALDSDA